MWIFAHAFQPVSCKHSDVGRKIYVFNKLLSIGTACSIVINPVSGEMMLQISETSTHENHTGTRLLLHMQNAFWMVKVVIVGFELFTENCHEVTSICLWVDVIQSISYSRNRKIGCIASLHISGIPWPILKIQNAVESARLYLPSYSISSNSCGPIKLLQSMQFTSNFRYPISVYLKIETELLLQKYWY